MNATNLSELDGKIVLICSARDHRNPPTGMRGTLHVVPDPEAAHSAVRVELDFPQMFLSPVHHRTVTLRDEELTQMLASEQDGAFNVLIHDPLDPEAPGENDRVVAR